MKKLGLFLLPVAILFAGCELDIDLEAIEQLLTQGIDVSAEPVDQGVEVNISGLPAELAQGLDGISIYVSEESMSGIPAGELGEPKQVSITADTAVTITGLKNGTKYFFEGRGELADGEATLFGFGGGFYPRPGGFGSFLGGPDPGGDTDPSQGIVFDTETGEVSAIPADSSVDFFYYSLEGNAYISNAQPLGGSSANGIKDAEKEADEWLDVKDADSVKGNYSAELMLETGKIYQFYTDDGEHFGKLMVEDVTADTVHGGEVLRVWLRYAFQTAKHVGHY